MTGERARRIVFVDTGVGIWEVAELEELAAFVVTFEFEREFDEENAVPEVSAEEGR